MSFFDKFKRKPLKKDEYQNPYESYEGINFESTYEDDVYTISDLRKNILAEIQKLEMSDLSDVENLIEKMACWYELIYPDYEINRLIPGLSQELKDVNTIMYNNVVNNSNLVGNCDGFNWRNVFGIDAFLELLSSSEAFYLKEPKYYFILYVNYAHFHIDDKGYIIEGEELYRINDNKNPLKLIYINIKGASKFAKKVNKECYCKLKELGAITYDLILEKSNKENWTKEELDNYLLHNRSVKACLKILEDSNFDKVALCEYLLCVDEVQSYYDKNNMLLYFSDNEFNGMHVNDVYQYLLEAKVFKSKLKEFIDSITSKEKLLQQRELILDSVLYRIIERGGKRVGPRRGLLFAKEFNRNIDIPMMYAYDFSDPGLRNLINQYIKMGGTTDLQIYDGYPFDANFKFPADTISIKDILSDEKRYTEEELELYKALVTSLYNAIDQDKLKQEKAKQKTIARKLV